MGIRIEQVDLPGIGTRHDIVTHSGRRLSIVEYRDGDRNLGIFDVDDPDACRDSIPITEDEAEAIADLLGTSVAISKLTRLSDDVEGVYTEQLAITPTSPFINHPLGDTKARTRTHVSIVAIARDNQVIPSPTPDEVLRVGDTVIAVGTREGLDAVGRLIANGPD